MAQVVLDIGAHGEQDLKIAKIKDIAGDFVWRQLF
jgi:hypothetical protein